MDLERYGDYNEYEFDAPEKKGIVGRILKILIFIVCFGVIGILLFRVIINLYYPDTVNQYVFDEDSIAFYNENGETLPVKTQDLRFPYDDANKGRFFCNYLYFVQETGSLQITLRYNDSLVKVIKDELGVDIDPSSPDTFTFRIAKNPGDSVEEESIPVGYLGNAIYDDYMMYNYYKLVFCDVDFTDVEWIRLEIFVNGVEMESPYTVLIYENNDNYSTFEDYELSSEELPE